MAEEVQIRNTNEIGKVRHPLGIIGLALITFGIYAIVWYYKTNKELAAIGKAHGTDECGDNPTTSVLAVTLGVFILVPPFVSYYNFTKRLDAAERATGTEQGMEPGLLFLLLILIGPVGVYLFQSNLNKVLEKQAGGAGATLPQGQGQAAPEQPTPAQQQ